MSELIKTIVHKYRDKLPQYYKELRCILTRHDIKYIMDNCVDETCINNDIHYIFLTYLNNGIIVKIISEYSDIHSISEYTTQEVLRLLDGPLKERNWSHIRQIYMAGFRDDVLISYGSEIKPSMLGYCNENEIYEYMLKLHPTIPYCDTYQKYYEIWYRANPLSVKNHKLLCTMKNINMLKKLGFKEIHKYIRTPTGNCMEYDREWAKYYIGCYILDGKCPYDAIDWETDIYNSSLESHILASYFRYFKKHGIKTDKRYHLCISNAEKYNNIPIIDIIDNVSYSSILNHYIETGNYKEYLPEYLVEEYTYTILYQPTDDILDRLIGLKYVKSVHICFQSSLTNHMAKIFEMNGIKVSVSGYDFMSLCIAMEYNLTNIEEIELDISNTYRSIHNDGLYNIIMYPNGLIALWNRFPSLILLNIILKYAPNIIHKIKIPEHIAKFNIELCIDKNINEIRNKYIKALDTKYKVDIKFKFM